MSRAVVEEDSYWTQENSQFNIYSASVTVAKKHFFSAAIAMVEGHSAELSHIVQGFWDHCFEAFTKHFTNKVAEIRLKIWTLFQQSRYPSENCLGFFSVVCPIRLRFFIQPDNVDKILWCVRSAAYPVAWLICSIWGWCWWIGWGE